MKNIQIISSQFFEVLKLRDTSMWEIFSQMIDGEEKEIVFLDDNQSVLFTYKLPKTQEKLKEDQKLFSKEFALKITELN